MADGNEIYQQPPEWNSTTEEVQIWKEATDTLDLTLSQVYSPILQIKPRNTSSYRTKLSGVKILYQNSPKTLPKM